MSTPSTPADSYHRTEDFESRIDSVLLPNEAWAVFAHLEKPITCAEVARLLNDDTVAVQNLIDQLVAQKLARKHLVNWRDFLAQKGIKTGPTRMSPAGPQTEPVARVVSAPKVEKLPVAASSRVAPAAAAPAVTVMARAPEPRIIAPQPVDPDGTITFTLVNEGARRARRAHLSMAITFRLGATSPAAVRIAPAAPVTAAHAPEPVAAAPLTPARAVTDSVRTSAPRKLRPLIEAITRKGGGGLKGQLLVYRVFLRVPPTLMFDAGIKSLSLVDDSHELRDDQFYEAIRSAARSVASIDLDAVYA